MAAIRTKNNTGYTNKIIHDIVSMSRIGKGKKRNNERKGSDFILKQPALLQDSASSRGRLLQKRTVQMGKTML